MRREPFLKMRNTNLTRKKGHPILPNVRLGFHQAMANTKKMFYFLKEKWIYSFCVWRQRSSVVRVGDLDAEDPGSNPRLGLLIKFSSVIPGANSLRFVNSQLVFSYQLEFLTGREPWGFYYNTEKPL